MKDLIVILSPLWIAATFMLIVYVVDWSWERLSR